MKTLILNPQVRIKYLAQQFKDLAMQFISKGNKVTLKGDCYKEPKYLIDDIVELIEEAKYFDESSAHEIKNLCPPLLHKAKQCLSKVWYEYLCYSLVAILTNASFNASINIYDHKETIAFIKQLLGYAHINANYFDNYMRNNFKEFFERKPLYTFAPNNPDETIDLHILDDLIIAYKALGVKLDEDKVQSLTDIVIGCIMNPADEERIENQNQLSYAQLFNNLQSVVSNSRCTKDFQDMLKESIFEYLPIAQEFDEEDLEDLMEESGESQISSTYHSDWVNQAEYQDYFSTIGHNNNT